MCDACRKEWSQFIRRVEESRERDNSKRVDPPESAPSTSPPDPAAAHSPDDPAHASHPTARRDVRDARHGGAPQSTVLESPTMDRPTPRPQGNVEPAGPLPSSTFTVGGGVEDGSPVPPPEAPPGASAAPAAPVAPEPAQEEAPPADVDDEKADTGEPSREVPVNARPQEQDPVSADPPSAKEPEAVETEAPSGPAPMETPIPTTPPQGPHEEARPGEASETAPRGEADAPFVEPLGEQRYLCPRCTAPALVVDLDGDDVSYSRCERCYFEVHDLLSLVPVKPVSLVELTLGAGPIAAVRGAAFVAVCLALFTLAIAGL